MARAEHNAPLTPERLEWRHSLCEASVTLNGNRAKISGVRNAFATVTDLETRMSCEFAWETVARIVERGGNFKS